MNPELNSVDDSFMGNKYGSNGEKPSEKCLWNIEDSQKVLGNLFRNEWKCWGTLFWNILWTCKHSTFSQTIFNAIKLKKKLWKRMLTVLVLILNKFDRNNHYNLCYHLVKSSEYQFNYKKSSDLFNWEILISYFVVPFKDFFQFTMNCGNKPAAQAAGADPSRCNSTNRPNPPLQ